MAAQFITSLEALRPDDVGQPRVLFPFRSDWSGEWGEKNEQNRQRHPHSGSHGAATGDSVMNRAVGELGPATLKTGL